MIKADSADKILYGADFPRSNPAKTVETVERLGLSEAEKEKIYHKNAEKLLQI